jgi:ATP-binding protein involved in chromosome partitioning
MMGMEEIAALLPEQMRARLRSARIADGTATLVFDASGLSGNVREGLEADARAILDGREGIGQVRVAMMADKVKRQIVAIGSGKGGVGKSTLAANLAVALAKAGHKVGLVDADIYGPSQPMLLGTEGQRPQARDKTLIPIVSPTGIPVLSVGNLVEPGRAVAWRGPMTGGALTQMMEADWGDAELLLVDLPPGTGDIQLTMIQRFKPDGAVIVSTPQDLSLIDARRAVSLFEQADVPIIGMIENMAGYVCPHCGELSDPFGLGGAESAAAAMGAPFLGRIPLTLSIRISSDAGQPLAAGEGPEAEAFNAIAAQVAAWLDKEAA